MHFLPRRDDGFDIEPETLREPTVPVPMNSEVRIKVGRKSSAVVDIVTADLQLDPRSEEYIGDPSMIAFPKPRLCVPAPLQSTPAKARFDSCQTMRSPVSVQKPVSKAQARRDRAKLALVRRRAS